MSNDDDRYSCKYRGDKTDDYDKMREVESTKYDKFTTLLKKFVIHKNDYVKLTNEGGLSKELNRKCITKFVEYDTAIKRAYEDLNIRKNNFTVNNYAIELYMREIKEPLTVETLGKYFYKFYYENKVVNDKEDEKSRGKNSNYLTKLMLKFIENERYIEDNLSIRAPKYSKKEIDYSIYFKK